jgi:hypothetical protein
MLEKAFSALSDTEPFPVEIIYLAHEARGAGGSIKPGVKSRFIGTEPQDHVRND